MVKKEIKERESELKPLFNVVNIHNEVNDEMPAPNSTIEILDSILNAREELFDKQLKDNMKAHRKLAGLLMK